MTRHPKTRLVRRLFLAAVLLALAGGAAAVQAGDIEGGPTGWCTDADGNNYPC